MFSRQLCTLWLNVGLYDQIEELTRELHAERPWDDGWLAINDTLRLHGEDMKPETKGRLEQLAEHLAPVALIESVNLYVCRETYNPLDLLPATAGTEITAENITRAELLLQEKAYRLGVEAGRDVMQVEQLLPALVKSRSRRIKDFCQGLVTRPTDIAWLVKSCCSAWRQADPSARTVEMLIGVLEQYAGLDRKLYEELLDQLMRDPDFARIFPCIQLGLDIDDQAGARLIACIGSGNAPLGSYWSLGHQSVVKRIDGEMLLRLLSALRSVHGSDTIVIDSLSCLISLSSSDQLPDLFLELAREFLERQVFSNSSYGRPSWDYNLGLIAKACLLGEEGANTARIVATNLLAGILDYSVTAYLDYPRLMDSLAVSQPIVFLDVFLECRPNQDWVISRIFDSASWHDDLGHRYNSLSLIENEILLQWCEMDPGHRFAALAQAIQLCYATPNEAGWPDFSWSPLALELLSKAPRSEDVLRAFLSVFSPQSWMGSRADVIAERLPLLHILQQHHDPDVSAWASSKGEELSRYVGELRVKEERENSSRFQRFE